MLIAEITYSTLLWRQLAIVSSRHWWSIISQSIDKRLSTVPEQLPWRGNIQIGPSQEQSSEISCLPPPEGVHPGCGLEECGLSQWLYEE